MKYDKTEFFETLKLVQEYQVGNEYYFLDNNVIRRGNVQKVEVEFYDHGMKRTVDNEMSTKFKLTLCTGSSSVVKGHENLFKTKAEAGFAFLKDNDVPSELLQVIFPDKKTTTVQALIEKLSTIDPDLDLEDDFWDFLKEVESRYVRNLAAGRNPYWDCECKTNYIHSNDIKRCTVCNSRRENCPDSHVEEMTIENMAKEGQ